MLTFRGKNLRIMQLFHSLIKSNGIYLNIKLLSNSKNAPKRSMGR